MATTTQFWAIIANIYSPVLVVAFAFQVYQRARNSTKARPVIWGWALRLAIFLAIIYGIRTIDYLLGLWPYFGLDYSTHTAFALIFSWLLWQTGERSDQWEGNSVLVLAFCSYLALMYLLNYHTVGDMFSTIAIVAPMIALADHYFLRHIASKPTINL